MLRKRQKQNPQDLSDEKRRGPEPERVKIEGDWEDAVKDALQKKRPKGGWPKPTEKDKDKKKD